MLKKTFEILIMFAILISCEENKGKDKAPGTTSKLETKIYYSSLIDSLYTVDQSIQWEMSKASKNGDYEKVKELYLKEKIIFERHIPLLKGIYKVIGYPTIDKVGKESSSNFLTLIQHSDSDLSFQKKMLVDISKEVKKGNVSGKDYSYLTDRVQLAEQNPQIYGTQIYFDTETAQVFPKNLIDSVNVNNRRELIGLEPIEEYLNKALIIHYEMNKGHYKEIDILEPRLHIVK